MELNLQGRVRARLFSRQVPSPIGLHFQNVVIWHVNGLFGPIRPYLAHNAHSTLVSVADNVAEGGELESQARTGPSPLAGEPAP